MAYKKKNDYRWDFNHEPKLVIPDRFDMTHGGSGGTREGSGEPHEGSGVFDRCCTCGQKNEKLFFSETPKNHVFRKKLFFTCVGTHDFWAFQKIFFFIFLTTRTAPVKHP